MKIISETKRLITKEILPSDFDEMFELPFKPEVYKYFGNKLLHLTDHITYRRNNQTNIRKLVFTSVQVNARKVKLYESLMALKFLVLNSYKTPIQFNTFLMTQL